MDIRLVLGLSCKNGLFLEHPCVVLRLKCLGPCLVLKILCFCGGLEIYIGLLKIQACYVKFNIICNLISDCTLVPALWAAGSH